MLMMKNKDTFINHLLSIIGGVLMTIVCGTIVANFGGSAMISIIMYCLTVCVYTVIYLLWKD